MAAFTEALESYFTIVLVVHNYSTALSVAEARGYFFDVVLSEEHHGQVMPCFEISIDNAFSRHHESIQ